MIIKDTNIIKLVTVKDRNVQEENNIIIIPAERVIFQFFQIGEIEISFIK